MAVNPPREPGRIRRYLREHTFVRHVLTLMSGTAVAQVLPMITTPIITRLFTATEYGSWAVVMSVASAVIPLAALRYDLAILLVEDRRRATQLVWLCSWINAGVAITTTLVMIALAPWVADLYELDRSASSWLYAVGLIIWAFGQMAIFTYWLTRNQRFSLISRNKIYQSVTVAGTQVGLGLGGIGVFGLIAGTLLGQLSALTNLWRKGGIPERVPLTKTDAKSLLKEFRKMPLLNGPNAVVDSIRLQGINLLIGAVATTAVLGQFTAAWALVQAPAALVSSALAQVFFQRLASTKPGHMFAMVRKSLLITMSIAIVPFMLIYFLAPPLLPLLLGGGDKWANAALFASALTPWLYMNFSTSPISNLFVVAQRQEILLGFAVVYMAVPLSIIWFNRTDMVATIQMVSWAMAGLLACFCVIALLVARSYDSRAPNELV
ncbi:MAG: oligosaccharide flippase family protein [Propionibacteriaceae bacterium]|nr:oligosaccharide flippase family protein [Propionibacteriaceae bacterium]